MILTDFLRSMISPLNTKENSNIWKLTKIPTEQMDELNETFQKIEDWQDLNQAKGKVLDALGEKVGQKRGVTSDEIYRVLIKARVARNNSDGTINKMINALAVALNTDPSTIKLRPLWEEGQPAAIRIEGIPLTALNRTGLSIPELGYIAQQITAGGIKIATVDLSGTFSLSSKPNQLEQDRDTGLAPIDQSAGGTLGATYDPAGAPDLPI